MQKPPNLLDILRHKKLSFHQIECPCTKEHLIEIASHLTGWETVASFLGLRDTHEEAIREKYHRNTRKQTEAMLLMWRDEYGETATYKVLMKAFLKVGKTSLVETTCDVFKSGPPPATHQDLPPVPSIDVHSTTAHLSTQRQSASASPTLQTDTTTHDVQQLLPSVDDSVLSEDDLGEVLDEVIDLAGRWTSLCTALRLKASAEDTIARQYFHNPGDCLKAVLRKWLCKEYNTEKHGLPTWRMLVEAVEKPAGGSNPALAKEIKKQHLIVMPIQSAGQPTPPELLRFCSQQRSIIIPQELSTHSRIRDQFCSERRMECSYCGLNIKCQYYERHVDNCGSQTDVCNRCLQRVMLKDMDKHRWFKCGGGREDASSR